MYWQLIIDYSRLAYCADTSKENSDISNTSPLYRISPTGFIETLLYSSCIECATLIATQLHNTTALISHVPLFSCSLVPYWLNPNLSPP